LTGRRKPTSLSFDATCSEWWRPGPQVIAHRGASHYAPENTLAAFRLAAELGADAVELDAKLSADGVVVVHHDLTLARTTNGFGRLSRRSLSELKALDAGAKFAPRFAGEPIPTLAEVFEAVGQRLLINVELTNYENVVDRLVKTVVGLVRAHELESRVLFSSFNPFALRAARRLSPDIPRGLLVGRSQKGWMRAVMRRVTAFEAYHPQDSMTDRNTIADEHAHGRRVNVWTVDAAERMHELLLFGCDGLITDVPDVAREAVQNVANGR
jgi:glycerophosphoryl diester phosphodiesterase